MSTWHTEHTWVFRRIARPAHAGAALRLLAVVAATPRRRALPQRTRDAPCFPKNPRALGIAVEEAIVVGIHALGKARLGLALDFGVDQHPARKIGGFGRGIRWS